MRIRHFVLVQGAVKLLGRGVTETGVETGICSDRGRGTELLLLVILRVHGVRPPVLVWQPGSQLLLVIRGCSHDGRLGKGVVVRLDHEGSLHVWGLRDDGAAAGSGLGLFSDTHHDEDEKDKGQY